VPALVAVERPCPRLPGRPIRGSHERARAHGRRRRLRAPRQAAACGRWRGEHRRRARADRRPRRRVGLRQVDARAGRRSGLVRPDVGVYRLRGAARSCRSAPRPAARASRGCSSSSRTPTRRSTPAGRVGAQLADALDTLDLVRQPARPGPRAGAVRARRAAGDRAVPVPARVLGGQRTAHRDRAHARRRARRCSCSTSRSRRSTPQAQAQLANLLVSLSRELGLGLLSSRTTSRSSGHVADAVSVMYLGRMVETGPTAASGSSRSTLQRVADQRDPTPTGAASCPSRCPGEVPDPGSRRAAAASIPAARTRSRAAASRSRRS
jgi:hypothetical protein